MNGHKREADTAIETMEEKKGKLDHGEKVEEDEVFFGGAIEGEEEERRRPALTSLSARSKMHG